MKNTMMKVLGTWLVLRSICVGGCLVLGAGAAFAAEGVPYRAWNEATRQMETRMCTDYTAVTAETGAFENGKWYVVTGAVSRGTITVNVAAHLILCDGATLTATGGIRVNEGNALSVYAQSEGDGMGKLITTGAAECAGIGGGNNGAGGVITINGGAVTATGGGEGAGIGGGAFGGSGTIAINGGVVTAAGTNGAAGIGGVGGEVTIAGGVVTATGSANAAGIGSGNGRDCGTVKISGGVVTATGGSGGAGIGGGYGGIGGGGGGTIAITGGTVTATGGGEAADIGSGAGGSSGAVTIAGGSVTAVRSSIKGAPVNSTGQPVHGVTVSGLEGPISLEGLNGYGADGIVADHAGRIVLWLQDGHYGCVINGADYVIAVNGEDTEAVPGSLTGVTVNGVDVGVGSGTGWAYDAATRYVEVTGQGSYVLSGTNTAGEVMFAIDADANVTLSNLCLRCMTKGECCLWATNDVTLTLFLAGTNTLDASANGEGICIENDTHLTITNAVGFADEDAVLIAKGGDSCAAIAVAVKASGKRARLVLAGGTVDARGGAGAAGIGGSYYYNWTCGGYNSEIAITGGRIRAYGGAWLSTPGRSGSGAGIGSAANNYWGSTDIAISGGFVEAYGGSNAAGIGGGCDSLCGVVTVSGGTVFACRDGVWASDMVCGDCRSAGDFRISGGSVILANGDARPQPVFIPSDGVSAQKVWCVTVPNLDDGAQEISGLPESYGLEDVVVRDGKLCLWLPDGDYEFSVNGDSYVATVSGANAVAIRRGKLVVVADVLDAEGVLIGSYPTVPQALASVTNGCTLRLLADITEEFDLATDCDLVLADNGFSAKAHLTVRRGCATLSRGFATDVVKLDSGSDTNTPACVRFAAPVPDGDVYLSVLNADLRIGLPIVRGSSVAAKNVRVCQSGYAAFARDGNVVLDTVWSEPFVAVTVDEAAGLTNFTPFATFAEAIQSGDTVGLLDYVNDAMLFETNVVVGDVSVPAERAVTLCSVLRYSDDGTNTAWRLGADVPVTLAGNAEAFGTLVLSDVRIEGALTVHAGATLGLLESYALTNGHLYVTVAEPAAMKETVLVTSEFWSAAELKRSCRVTNPGWTFVPVEGRGLVLAEVGDFVARLGDVCYGTVEAAFAATSDGDTVALISTTNADTHAASDSVTVTSRVFTVGTPGTVRVDSARRVTTGSEAVWEDPPAQPTAFDLDGVEVHLALGAELALGNVQVAGKVTLSGDGLLVVSNYTGQGRIRVRIADAGEVAARRPIAVGSVEHLELVDSVGELVQSGDYVYWQYDIFAYTYEQRGNGIAYVTVNDGGKVKELGPIESKVGTCTFTYVRENGEERELLLHLVCIDYDKAVVHVPTDIETKYLSEDGGWKVVRDGDTITADWKVDANGDLTFLFDGQQRKVKGISSKPIPAEDVPGVIGKQAQEDQKKGGSQIGGIIGGILGTATIGGILGGIAAGIGAGAGGGGGALAGAIGAGGLAGLVGGGAGGVDIPEIDVDPGPGENIEPEIPQQPDPQVQEMWQQRWEKFHNIVSKFFDAVTIAQAVKDLVVMWTCPLEYKGLPHFATSFENVHRSAQDDDDVRHAVHWFFSSSIHGADLLGKGCVDISADRSMADFILTEAQAGSLEKGSDFERFQDAINWVMRIDAIFTSLVNEKVSWASIGGEVVTLFKNIVQQCRKNGYFDPPVDASVMIPSGGHYTVSGMKFGIKEGKPAQPRTEPIIEVKSGATLRLSECSFANYVYNTQKGLIHVESGAVLSLDATTFSGNASLDGTAPVVVDEGGIVWLYGKTAVDNLAAVKGDVRVGFGPYRGASPKAGYLTGEVYIGGDTCIDGRIGSVEFEMSTGWENIRSLKRDRWYMPSIRGNVMYWDYRPGAKEQLRPRFSAPGFSISLVEKPDGRYAHLSGVVSNAWNSFYYTPIGAKALGNRFEPVASSTLQSADGKREISVDVPVGDSPTGFFNVELSDVPLK